MDVPKGMIAQKIAATDTDCGFEIMSVLDTPKDTVDESRGSACSNVASLVTKEKITNGIYTMKNAITAGISIVLMLFLVLSPSRYSRKALPATYIGRSSTVAETAESMITKNTFSC